MARRKTVNVDDLRVQVNDMLRLSTCSREMRCGMRGILETVLHNTGNYRGFRYLDQDEVPKGALPGIIRKGSSSAINGGNSALQYKPSENGILTENIFPDDSRVEYY